MIQSVKTDMADLIVAVVLQKMRAVEVVIQEAKAMKELSQVTI